MRVGKIHRTAEKRTISRREIILGASGVAAVMIVGGTPGDLFIPAARAQQTAADPPSLPTMPARNPWLIDSVYPTDHQNSASTGAVLHAGPITGRALMMLDVKALRNVLTPSPKVKKIGNETVVIGPGFNGITKVRATGKAFDFVSFLPYPFATDAQPRIPPDALAVLLADTDDAVRVKDRARLVALAKRSSDLGLNRVNLFNGAYSVIDKDGFHYSAFDGTKIVKVTDDNDPQKPLRIERLKDFSADMPVTRNRPPVFLGVDMTYDGHIAATTEGALLLIDRDLNLRAKLPFTNEAVQSGICFDETGTYLATSRRVFKVVWTGSKLSFDEADGGWASEYNTRPPEQRQGAARRIFSRYHPTPALMGFGSDPDKLLVMTDGDPAGANVVAFWRDDIPGDFQQKDGTKSRRIADQMRTDISNVVIESSPSVLGYGIAVLNAPYPNLLSDIWDNVPGSDAEPPPRGVQKFVWNPDTKALEKSWLNREIDASDAMVPVVSAGSNMMYISSKSNGIYGYAGLDWTTGAVAAHWSMPDGNRKWNNFGGVIALLEDGDFLLGGLFGIKRTNMSEADTVGRR